MITPPVPTPKELKELANDRIKMEVSSSSSHQDPQKSVRSSDDKGGEQEQNVTNMEPPSITLTNNDTIS